MAKQKILLAFSGGLDTSAIIPWLIETQDAEIIAYCSDLGNSPDGEYLNQWARKLGAVDFIFEDLRDRFATEFAFPAVRAGATYQDDYLLGTALGRPLIAERMAYFAKKFGATGISHGATGKGNDQLRFENSWAYLVPDVKVIAPWKIWNFKGRQDLLKYLSAKGFDLNSAEKRYSVDVNLFHRSCEGGILENPAQEYRPEDIYEWVAAPAKQLKEPKIISIKFENGFPVAVADGAGAKEQALSPAALLSLLNQAAGAAGIGVADLVEERANGVKSRGVYETPGGTLLHLACRSLKHLSWGRSLMTIARTMGNYYGELVYDGFWHSEARVATEAFFQASSKTLSGTVALRLEAGQARVVSRNSPFGLYDENMVTFESDEHGLHKYAEGYCKTVGFKQWRAGLRDQKNGLNLIR